MKAENSTYNTLNQKFAKHRTRLLCLLLFGFLNVLSVQLPAQNILRNARLITTDEGLSQSTINVIFQDSEGFMWFGTQNGLNRYDGQRFICYTNSPTDSTTISNNWIFSISEDSKANLWIGTRNGLNMFDRASGKFVHFFHRPNDTNSIGDNAVYSVLVDKRNFVWVKTRSLLHKFVPSEHRFYRYEHYTEYFRPSQSDINFPIIEDQQGKIWVGSKTGLDHFDPETDTFNKFFHDPADTSSLTDNHITALLQDSEGRIWVATANGLNQYRPESDNFQQYHFVSDRKDNSNFNTISSIAEDYQQNLWLGTQGGGLIRIRFIEEDGRRRFTASNFLLSSVFPKGHRNNIVYSLHEDNSRNLWIGTDVSGLLLVDLKPKKFEWFADESQPGLRMPSNTVSATFRAKDGSYWIGTRGMGIVRYQPETRKSTYLNTSDSSTFKLVDNYIHCIVQDSMNRIWIGTREGIHIYESDRKKMHNLTDYFPHIFYANFQGVQVNQMFQDSRQNMWIASNRGLHYFNTNTGEVQSYFHDYNDPNTLSDNMVYDIVEDPSGTIWIATFNGLNRLLPNTNRIERYEAGPHGLINHNTVYSLALQNDTCLWVGTANGLNRIHLANLQSDFINSSGDMVGNEIFKIIAAPDGRLWGTTGKGVFRLDPYTLEINHFNKNDGLQSLEFNNGVGCLSSDNEILFGSVAGMLAFKPTKMEENTYVPPIHITSLRAITPQGEQKIYIGSKHAVELSHNAYDITIEFAALDYTASAKNQYAYQLLGHSNEWIEVGHRNFVSLTRLSPGRYTFRVKGSNNDNIWNAEGDTITLIINPPWWLTIWAYLSYISVAIGIIYTYIRYRERQLKYAKLQLEQSVRQRTLEIEQQKEEIATQRDLALKQRNQIEAQRNELSQTLEQLKATQAQLVESEKMASLGNLVAGVAHEINTPVGIGITGSSALVERIQEFAEMLRSQTAKRNDLQEFLRQAYQNAKLILSNLQRTAELVRSFKQISVDESTEQMREFELKAYITDVLRSLQPKFKNRSIDIQLHCPHELTLKSYPGALAQIITNLIINSLQHGFSDTDTGSIDIACSVHKNSIRIEYSDTGKGIPAEIRKQIFDPFFTTDMKSGTGLGMHIVYNLATQKLGGTLRCTCTDTKQGASFLLELPKVSQ